MARVKVKINKNELIAAIEKAEANGPLKNRSVLHEKVAATDWAKNHQPKPITASVVLLRIEEFGIEPKTPKGRKGRRAAKTLATASVVQTGTQRAKTRSEKFSDPKVDEIFDNLAAKAPQSFQNLIKRARKGSTAAAIKLNCAQCVGFESTAANVRGCTASDCPLWPIRPYQRVLIEGEEINDSDIDEGAEAELAEAATDG